jgi:hypothetical protein
MYERNLGGNLGRVENFTGVSLFTDLISCFFGYSFMDGLVLLYIMIYPVIESYSTVGVLLYLIGQFQTWNLTLPKYIVKCGGTDAEFLCYTSLFLIVIQHPFCEFVQPILFFFMFLWTKIRYSDTLVSISNKKVEDNLFVRWKEKLLTCIAQYVTM